jgi:hypothetical protein
LQTQHATCRLVVVSGKTRLGPVGVVRIRNANPLLKLEHSIRDVIRDY